MPFLLFLGTLRARLAVGAALCLALVSWRAYDIHNQRAIGAEKVVVAAKEHGAKANEKSEAARAAAERPGAAERVLKSFCRDC